jgi:DNA-binding beta-propeller fold protein YncE
MLEALDAWKAGKPVPDAPAPPPPPHPAYEQFSKKAPSLATTLGTSHTFAYKAAYGSRGRGNGQFMLPSCVTVDGTGRLYVSDAIRADIQVLERTGKYIRRMGSEGTIIEDGLKFLNPSAIAVDRKGRVYVADTKNSRIMVAADNGEMELQFGRPLVVVGLHDEQGTIGFNYPRGLALDQEEGLLYVADTGNNRLRLFNAEGTPVQTFGTRGDRPGEFNAPLGLAVGAAGRLYVADSQNYRIQIFDRGFRFVEAFGKRGGGAGEFYHPPTHAAVTIHGEVLVCDDSDKMHVFSESGKFIAYVAGPRAASPTPKYFAAAFYEGEDLYAVDENGCQVHHFVFKEKEKGL